MARARGRPRRPALGLLGWLLLTFAAAAIGALGSAGAGRFYEQLARPGWAPPAWLFAPAWTALYLLMAVAAWLVWRRHGFRGAPVALGLFVLQLAANALWTWLFFVWREGNWAFTEIVVLWLLIAGTLLVFARRSALAAALLSPYLIWVTYAAALTYAAWKLNPAVLGS